MSDPITEILTAAAVVAAALGLLTIALRGRRNPRWVLVDGLVAAAATGAVALVGAVGFLELTGYGILHLAYLGLTITVPAVTVGWIVLLAVRDQIRVVQAVVGLALVSPAPVGLYATHVAPFQLHTDEAVLTIGDDRTGDDPILVGVIADLQTPSVGRHEREAVERVMASAPDIIVIAGDFVQSAGVERDETLDDMVELLNELEAPGGVYFVRGDVDSDEEIERLVEGTDMILLDDGVVETSVGDRVVRVGGNRLEFRTESAVSAHRVLSEQGTPGAVRILVSHRPDVVLDLEPGDVELVIAGHTHGGQVVAPLLGPPFALTDVAADVAAGGLHAVDGVAIYVSTGVGLQRGQAPQVRLFSRPSVGLVTIQG